MDVGGTLSPLDELPVHQAAAPFAGALPGESSRFDFFWLHLAHPGGDFAAQVGYVQHPDAGTESAFFLARDQREQYNLSVTQPISAVTAVDRQSWSIHVGPLSFQIVDPFHTWGFRLAPGALGAVSAEVEFAAAGPVNQVVPIGRDPADRVRAQHWCHYEQSGRFRGVLRFPAGRKAEAAPLVERQFWDVGGVRDRSWGSRPHDMEIVLWSWWKVYAGSWEIFLIYQEDAGGDCSVLRGAVFDHATQRHRRVVAAKADFRFAPRTRMLRAGAATLTLADGATVDVAVSPLGLPLLFRGAWGEQPWHSAESGTYTSHWTLSTELLEERGSSMKQQAVNVVVDGELRGTGLVEHAVSGRHVRYGPQIRRPEQAAAGPEPKVDG